MELLLKTTIEFARLATFIGGLIMYLAILAVARTKGGMAFSILIATLTFVTALIYTINFG